MSSSQDAIDSFYKEFNSTNRLTKFIPKEVDCNIIDTNTSSDGIWNDDEILGFNYVVTNQITVDWIDNIFRQALPVVMEQVSNGIKPQTIDYESLIKSVLLHNNLTGSLKPKKSQTSKVKI